MTAAARSGDRWSEIADRLQPSGQAVIGGERVGARDGSTFEKTSAVDGRVLAAVAEGDAADIGAAVSEARAVFESGVWSCLAPRERKRIMVAFGACRRRSPR